MRNVLRDAALVAVGPNDDELPLALTRPTPTEAEARGGFPGEHASPSP